MPTAPTAAPIPGPVVQLPEDPTLAAQDRNPEPNESATFMDEELASEVEQLLSKASGAVIRLGL